MALVTVTVNSRNYKLQCDDGEEDRLHKLVDILNLKIDGLAAQFGQAGSDRLVVMAGLLLADELLELQERGPAKNTTVTIKTR